VGAESGGTGIWSHVTVTELDIDRICRHHSIDPSGPPFMAPINHRFKSINHSLAPRLQSAHVNHRHRRAVSPSGQDEM
jgi:hypothetical protein